MIKKISINASFVCVLVFLTGNALAQFPNLKDLKDLKDKFKQAQPVVPDSRQQPANVVQQPVPQQKNTPATFPAPVANSLQEFNFNGISMNMPLKEYYQLVTSSLKGKCIQEHYKKNSPFQIISPKFVIGDYSINCEGINFMGQKTTVVGYFGNDQLKVLLVDLDDVNNKTGDVYPSVWRSLAKTYQFNLPDDPLSSTPKNPRNIYDYQVKATDKNGSAFVLSAKMQIDLSGVIFENILLSFITSNYESYIAEREKIVNSSVATSNQKSDEDAKNRRAVNEQKTAAACSSKRSSNECRPGNASIGNECRWIVKTNMCRFYKSPEVLEITKLKDEALRKCKAIKDTIQNRLCYQEIESSADYQLEGQLQ